MNPSRYTRTAMALHWGQAILIVWLLWLGWTMTDLPKGAERSAAYGLHKSLGLLALLLVGLRLAWRWRHPAPPALGQGWELVLSRWVHVGLYAFLLLAPLAGYLTSAFAPFAVKFFGIALPKLFAPDEGLNAVFKQVHLIVVWSGAALIGLHLLGALKHAFLRDGTLSRMLPGRRVQ